MPTSVEDTITTIWRLESAKILGGLMRMLRDLELAEDVAQEALLAALQTWPEHGVPENPAAWLTTTAKNRALDLLRQRAMQDRHKNALEIEQKPHAEAADAGENALLRDDDVLRMMLVACHPLLSREARVALTLRLVAGLSTTEIARAFLQTEPTIQQRIVRAKRTIAEARIPFEIPEGEELKARIESVLEVVYLVFNEGYAATHGEDWLRHDLANEALRLGRMLCALVPHEAEAFGLLALMEFQASRFRARVGAVGEPLSLREQNRSLWDQLLIQRAYKALALADRLRAPRGVYTLQAAIAACHARAPSVDATDWHEIVALYDALVEITGSPIVELNRAVAVGAAEGPAAALEIVDSLKDVPQLREYPHLASVRGEMLQRLGRFEEAKRAFEEAARVTQNLQEQTLFLRRASECTTQLH